MNNPNPLSSPSSNAMPRPRKSAPPLKMRDYLRAGRKLSAGAERIGDTALAEYGDTREQAVFFPRVAMEFDLLVRTAIHNGEETVTLPTTLAGLIACWVGKVMDEMVNEAKEKTNAKRKT